MRISLFIHPRSGHRGGHSENADGEYMGRESECVFECDDTRAKVKALIEPPDLILRGEIRRRFRISELRHIRADGDRLRFAFQRENFALGLGTALASKWARALSTPPPSLASKLGIREDTVVRMIGSADDTLLAAALATAKSVSDENADLILARVDWPDDVARALHTAADQLAARIPIWFIHPKGKGHALSEAAVRSKALAAGIVDTKVAAVSPALTAMRFVRRREV